MNETEDPSVAAAIAEERGQNEEAIERHPIVSQEEWLKQRLLLMEKETHASRRYASHGGARASLGEGREELHIHVSARRPDARGPVQAA